MNNGVEFFYSNVMLHVLQMSGNNRGKYGAKYSLKDLKYALSRVLEKRWTAYKAAKEYNIPKMTIW